MAKVKLSVIIPAYNEAQRIVPTILSVKQYFTQEKIAGEIIVVDDGSTDATGLAVTGFADQYVKLPVNQGKGAAIRKGVFAAKGDDILFMDADGSTSITAYEDLLAGRNGADIVIGSRHLEGSVIHIKQSLVRQTVSYLGNLVFRIFLRLPYADTQCGFKLFSRQSAHDIFSQTVIDRWGFDVEVLKIAQILGYKVSEVPIAWHDSRGSSLRAGRAAIYTLEEVIAIWLNVRMGKYKKIKKPKSAK
jgi:dolichyl-phosphate beta-glucosyltransferase